MNVMYRCALNKNTVQVLVWILGKFYVCFRGELGSDADTAPGEAKGLAEGGRLCRGGEGERSLRGGGREGGG